MSKQTVSKNQASRSVPEDSLGKPQHTKASQRPVTPAHESVRDNIDIDESKGGSGPKKKAAPANVGFWNEPGQERDSLNKRQINRVSRPVPGDAKEVPGGAAKARRAGPHGSVIHVDGTSQATGKK